MLKSREIYAGSQNRNHGSKPQDQFYQIQNSISRVLLFRGRPWKTSAQNREKWTPPLPLSAKCLHWLNPPPPHCPSGHIVNFERAEVFFIKKCESSASEEHPSTLVRKCPHCSNLLSPIPNCGRLLRTTPYFFHVGEKRHRHVQNISSSFNPASKISDLFFQLSSNLKQVKNKPIKSKRPLAKNLRHQWTKIKTWDLMVKTLKYHWSSSENRAFASVSLDTVFYLKVRYRQATPQLLRSTFKQHAKL